MVDLVLGIGAAVGASTLYSLGIALQAMDAKQAPDEEHLRLALAWNLVRRARWLTGTGLSILGWPLQVVALLLVPLVVVQPALAVGLVVLMFLAQRMLGEHAGRYEYLAMGAILAGVDRSGPDGSPAQHDARIREPGDHARACGLGARKPAPLSAARDRAFTGGGDDDRRGASVRMERGGDEARV